MELMEVKKMRTKQIAVINGMLLLALIIYFTLISFLHITFMQLFLFLGVFMLIQAIAGLLKGGSTKSFIPIFEEVSNYEKEKIGAEWKRQRRMSYISNFLFSGLMFLQAYWSLDSSDFISINFTFTVIWAVLITVFINIGMILHIKKVDRSTSQLDMKGYTWKSSLIAVAIGLGAGIVIFVLTILYVMSDLG
ncbi:hypothetical protein ABET41_10495 [Metabacillus fastidiosus]|uniref:Uncharacterized protein n=1 Tax=Metabacillus fastidiosus TaxID=1458 RepID=A0ABU6NSL9_9BACI|nr:hypothetical protein [Metabacillus fastidiosus]MED4399991.1 hypothetical protein [Metabacillus fastidiosus]MED4462475.1 hypothetical protein [Metabacillus fastidiosus]